MDTVGSLVDVMSFASAPCCLSSSHWELEIRGPLAGKGFEGCDPGLLRLDRAGRFNILIEGACVVLVGQTPLTVQERS